MSLYTDIQYTVAQYMAREDLTDPIIWAIARFEEFVNRNLLQRPMSVSQTSVPSGGVTALPVGFRAMRSVVWGGTPQRTLQFVTPDYFNAANDTANAGAPSIYKIEYEFVTIDSTSEEPLTMHYYVTNVYLSDAVPTNWLAASHTDLYIFGALAEINAYVQDVEAATLWKARRDEIMRELFMMEFRSPGPMVIQPTGATP